ncbi:hypothetical protein ACFL2O_09170 [Thermodesulfobacteriota bacterium]
MEKEKCGLKERKSSDMSRRDFCITVAGICLVGAWSNLPPFASAENAPTEPEDLDKPTPWQDGDPEPIEKQVPAVEPEQTSNEAPPCQPMDDDRLEQPSPSHVWVTGYWWWTHRTYMWVPGYWAIPPRANYVYVSGHWTYRNNQWVYVRGGWATPDTTSIVVYPVPRPLLTALVITAPVRILRRHYLWGYYPARRVARRVNRRINRRVRRRQRRRGR